MSIDLSTVEKVREFLRNSPPQSKEFQFFGSVLLAHLESKEKEILTLRKSLKVLGAVVTELLGAEPKEETPTAPEPGTVADEGQSGPRDKTPFPAGVKTSGPAAPASFDEVQAAEEIPQPNASSGPAVNAAPIPKKAPGKNGAKAEVQS